MTTTNEPKKTPNPGAAKLPYTKPKLVHLGSVRELTGTGNGSTTEGFGFPAPRVP